MKKTYLAKLLINNLFNTKYSANHRINEKLENTLKDYFSLPVYLVNSGRSAIYLILKAAGIGTGDEVLIQAYTCNAVPNPIIWTGAKPIYADIDKNTLNFDLNDLQKHITNKTRAIIVQHTFGRPGPIDEVLKIVKEKNLLLIEDCAHCLGASHKGQKLGTFGDAAILSFARGKVISSISGGAIIVKNEKLNDKIKSVIEKLPNTPKRQIFKDLFNFITWRGILRRVYFNQISYRVIDFLDKQDFFNPIYSRKEMEGLKPKWHPSKLNSLYASLALEEFSKLDFYNKRREEIAMEYFNNITNKNINLLPIHTGIYLRVVAFCNDPNIFFEKSRRYKAWFGNWYNAPVFPKETNLEKVSYKQKSCPQAEYAAAHTINLPNYPDITSKQLEYAINFLNKYDEL